MMNIALHEQLSTLGHEYRLAVFQLLMQAYPERIAAGEIARRLDLRPNTASDYLGSLKAARLITAERKGTSLLYSIDMKGAGALSKAFFHDCCGGRPELCLPSVQTQGEAC